MQKNEEYINKDLEWKHLDPTEEIKGMIKGARYGLVRGQVLCPIQTYQRGVFYSALNLQDSLHLATTYWQFCILHMHLISNKVVLNYMG